MKYLIVSVLFAFLLSACGQSGPLYLPKDYQQDNNKNKKGEGYEDATGGSGQSGSSHL